MDINPKLSILTDEQIREAFARVVGMQARAADVQVVQTLGGTVDVLAEYIWDHWMGEPEHPKAKDVEGLIIDALEKKETGNGA